MGYSLPQFNLPVKLWRFPNIVTNPADLTTVGNLVGSRPDADPIPSVGIGTLAQRQVVASYFSRFMTLLLPKLTDVRPPQATGQGDVLEVPSGTGRYYWVASVDDVGKGFANEHRFAYLVPLQSPQMAGLFGLPNGVTGWTLPIQ
jgi:hypothetical protein